MLYKILEKIDFKWWTSLEAQQKLTVGMAIIIVSLFGGLIMQQSSHVSRIREIRTEEGNKLNAATVRGDACYERMAIYLEANEKRLQDVLFEYQQLKNKVNESKKN